MVMSFELSDMKRIKWPSRRFSFSQEGQCLMESYWGFVIYYTSAGRTLPGVNVLLECKANIRTEVEQWLYIAYRIFSTYKCNGIENNSLFHWMANLFSWALAWSRVMGKCGIKWIKSWKLKRKLNKMLKRVQFHNFIQNRRTGKIIIIINTKP